MNVVDIVDANDPRLHDYTQLTDVALRRRLEPEHGLFIAEGELVITRAMRAGYQLRSVLTSPRWLDEIAAAVPDDATAYVAEPGILEQVTGFHVHRGALAAFARKPPADLDELLTRTHRLAIVENVNNPTNLGALFRSAAALGMQAVLLDPLSADPLYRRSVRVSMGEVFAIPHARLHPWPAALGLVQEAGFTVLALTPDADATPIDEIRPGYDDRIAVLLGAEGPGLTARALTAADDAVRIPMAARVDSLNVAAAAAVAFYALGLRPVHG